MSRKEAAEKGKITACYSRAAELREKKRGGGFGRFFPKDRIGARTFLRKKERVPMRKKVT